MTKPKPRTIEKLKEEYESLNERKIQTQTQLEEATKQLTILQKEAVAEFETSDIDELKTKLKQMEQENEKRRQEYQELLDSISSELKKIEDESNSPGKTNGDSND